MNENQIEDIYLTLLGQLVNSPWNDIVPNLYAEGSECDKLYGEVYDMKIRLSERLGEPDEDEDVEFLIDTLLAIAQIHSYEMFRCGWRLAMTENADQSLRS